MGCGIGIVLIGALPAGLPGFFLDGLVEQRIAAESRAAFDHGTQTLIPPSPASLAIEAKMLQVFRLAGVLLVPFFWLGGGRFPHK